MHGMVATNSRPASLQALAAARVLSGIAMALVAAAAHAGMLYKSIGANGVVQFSDTPHAHAVIIEQRPIGNAGAPASAAFEGTSGSSALSGLALASNPLLALGDGSADDDALARANAQVDLAEHALALARSALDANPARMHLSSAERTRADDDRIAFYEHDLKLARNNLLEMLKARRTALAAAAAEPGAPILGPLRKLASR